MPTVLQEARLAFDQAQWHLNVLLNLSEVPDHHPVSRCAARLWEDLEGVLGNLPMAGKRGKAIQEEAPAILPVVGKPLDQWMTSRGVTVRTAGMLSSSQSRLASSGELQIPKEFGKRRAMTKKEFLTALYRGEQDHYADYNLVPR